MKVAAIEQKTQVPSELLSASRFFDINSRERTFLRASLQGKKFNNNRVIACNAQTATSEIHVIDTGSSSELVSEQTLPTASGDSRSRAKERFIVPTLRVQVLC